MKTFKEFTHKNNVNIADIPDNLTAEEIVEAPQTYAMALTIELTELMWNILRLLWAILVFIVKGGFKVIWGSGKMLYARYNKQARSDRKFNRQMRRTTDQVAKLKLAKAGYMNSVIRLENMKDALDSMSKEDRTLHQKELDGYYKKIQDIQKQANNALKKLSKVK